MPDSAAFALLGGLAPRMKKPVSFEGDRHEIRPAFREPAFS